MCLINDCGNEKLTEETLFLFLWMMTPSHESGLSGEKDPTITGMKIKLIDETQKPDDEKVRFREERKKMEKEIQKLRAVRNENMRIRSLRAEMNLFKPSSHNTPMLPRSIPLGFGRSIDYIFLFFLSFTPFSSTNPFISHSPPSPPPHPHRP